MVCPCASNAPDMTEETAKAANKAYFIKVILFSDGQSAARPKGVLSGISVITPQWSKEDGVRSVDHALSQHASWNNFFPESTRQ